MSSKSSKKVPNSCCFKISFKIVFFLIPWSALIVWALAAESCSSDLFGGREIKINTLPPNEKMMYGAKESGKLYFSKDSEGNWLFEERVIPESELVQILKENEGKRVRYRPQMSWDSINWRSDTDLLMVMAGRWDKIMLDRSGKKESDLSFFEKRKWVDKD